MKNPKPGYIYFVSDRDNQFLKIGRTKEVQHRFKNLCRSNIDKGLVLIGSIFTKDMVVMETTIHQLFVPERVDGPNAKRGEWYYFRGAVAEFVLIALEQGLNEAIEFIAKHRKANREDWRTWNRLLHQHLMYQNDANGASTLQT